MQWKTESSKESNIISITDKEINLNKYILRDLPRDYAEGKGIYVILCRKLTIIKKAII